MAHDYRDEDNKIVTIHERKDVRPALEESRYKDQNIIPDVIYFELPDGTLQEVKTDQNISIGRHSRSEDPPVVIDLEDYDGHSMGVSRHHAMLRVVRNNLVLVDLDSINGTYINGKKAAPAKRYAIHDGDALMIGRIKLHVWFYKRR